VCPGRKALPAEARHERRQGGVNLPGLVGEPAPVSSVTLGGMSGSQKSRRLVGQAQGGGPRGCLSTCLQRWGPPGGAPPILLARPRGAGSRSAGEASPPAKPLWLCTLK